MNPEQLNVLRAEIHADPQGIGYDECLPDRPGHVVDRINAPTRTAIKSRMVTARAVLAEVPGGPAILDKLEAASAGSAAVRWAMRFLGQEAGIDVGSPATQGMLTQLAAAGVLTQAEAHSLRDMALQPASRAEQLGLPPVTEAHLRAAGVLA